MDLYSTLCYETSDLLHCWKAGSEHLELSELDLNAIKNQFVKLTRATHCFVTR